jgi:hypothetical protein
MAPQSEGALECLSANISAIFSFVKIEARGSSTVDFDNIPKYYQSYKTLVNFSAS